MQDAKQYQGITACNSVTRSYYIALDNKLVSETEQCQQYNSSPNIRKMFLKSTVERHEPLANKEGWIDSLGSFKVQETAKIHILTLC